MQKVLVIGAGASGLITAKRLLDDGFEVTILEKTETVGGTWVYREDVGEEVHSSMYKNLTTNLPKNTMCFIGYPFEGSLPTYMGHVNVLEYLENFSTTVGLKRYIRFHCVVIEILPSNPESPLTGKWVAKWINSEEEEEKLEEEEFDCVALCNGHYSVPHYPVIENLENFKGKILHSHSYRDNTSFKEQKVVIVGAGISGGDISRELLEVVDEVYLCMRNLPQMGYPSKFVQYKANVKRIDENGYLILENEETLQNIDCILFCTGYEYSFPFLNTQQDLIKLKHKRVCDLYLHIFPFNHLHPQIQHFKKLKTKDTSIFMNLIRSVSPNSANRSRTDMETNEVVTIFPTIAFIGLPWRVTPFPLFDYQAQYVGKVWSKQISLPSVEDILLDIQKQKDVLKRNNFPPHYLHMLGAQEYAYVSQLRRLINNEPLPEVGNNNNNTTNDDSCTTM